MLTPNFTTDQLGIVTNRNGARLDRQDLVLPLVFLFFPLLYACQIFVSLILVARNCFWRGHQGLKYYIYALLGMYAVNRKEDGGEDIVGKKNGNYLLIDNSRPIVQPSNKRLSEIRGIDLLVSLIGLYQTLSTSILYVRRRAIPAAGLLDVEHRIGLMALGGSVCSFSHLFLQLTGYNWVHVGNLITMDDIRRRENGDAIVSPEATLHIFQNDEHQVGNVLGTSSKYVCDCAFALGVHCVFLRLIRRVMPAFDRHSYLRPDQRGSLISWLPILLPYLAVVVTAVLLNLHIFLDMRMKNWYRPPGAGIICRSFIMLACLYVAITTLWSEVQEVERINDNRLDIWNAGWAWKDPRSDLLWPL